MSSGESGKGKTEGCREEKVRERVGKRTCQEGVQVNSPGVDDTRLGFDRFDVEAR